MVATWSDSEGSTLTEEETTKTTNLCLMALEDEVMSLEPQSEFTFEELNLAFHELLSKFKKAESRIKTLKDLNETL